jgi:hypothetical protein
MVREDFSEGFALDFAQLCQRRVRKYMVFFGQIVVALGMANAVNDYVGRCYNVSSR